MDNKTTSKTSFHVKNSARPFYCLVDKSATSLSKDDRRQIPEQTYSKVCKVDTNMLMLLNSSGHACLGVQAYLCAAERFQCK